MPRAPDVIEQPTMNTGSALVTGRPRSSVRKSRWPARLDWMQSVSGLVLALFMWGHMLFVSSILLGTDAMWTARCSFVRPHGRTSSLAGRAGAAESTARRCGSNR